MKLIELSYKNYTWELKNLRFDKVNLLVGKNAVGKSRTLEVIDNLNKFLDEKIGFIGNNNFSWSGWVKMSLIGI